MSVVKLRLTRSGSKKRPYYHIVAASNTSPRDGRYIERIGSYNPMVAKDDPNRVKLQEDRCKHWLSVGAQPTDRVARFFDAAGLIERKPRSNPNKGLPGKKRQEREAAEAAAAAEAAEAAAAAAQEPAAEAGEEAAAE
jgi:small subunit ribosomal protein S16